MYTRFVFSVVIVGVWDGGRYVTGYKGISDLHTLLRTFNFEDEYFASETCYVHLKIVKLDFKKEVLC
jgi:hypothetical protein